MGHKHVEKDKVLTMQKLIDAVGSLLKEKGFRKVRVNEIAEHAGVSKILIYRYFGGLEGLIAAYIKQKDFWLLHNLPEATKENLKNHIKQMFRMQISSMRQDEALKELHLWELAERKPLSEEIEIKRENNGLHIIELVEGITKLPQEEIAAIATIISSAITYLTLFEGMSDRYNGIDLKGEQGWEQIAKVIDLIIDLWYNQCLDSVGK